MLSSPAARGSKGDRFRSLAAADPCEGQHDLVVARARETEKRPNAERYSPNPHFRTPHRLDTLHG